MSYILQALYTLVDIIFGIYLFFVMLRLLFQIIRADFYNPVSQAVVKLTNPPLKLLRRIIPGYAGIDWPCVVLLLLVQGLEVFLLTLIYTGGAPSVTGLLVLTIARLLQLSIWIYLIAIFIAVIISWINPGAYNPVTVLIYQLTEPLLSKVRRRMPDMGGLDFSPMVVLLAGFLLLSLVVAPLTGWGHALNGMQLRVM